MCSPASFRGDTPFENLTEDPPPGVGPYEITESVPNRQFVLEKVDGFADLGIPDIPTGHLDKMTTSRSSRTRRSRRRT